MFVRISKGEPAPEAPGDLGKLKDEIEAGFPGKSAFINNFVAIGPKSYAYHVSDPAGNILDKVSKQKGISIVGDNPVDISDLLKLLEGSTFQYPQRLFRKNISTSCVEILDVTKKMKFMSDKRRIIKNSQNLDTIPYGWIDES